MLPCQQHAAFARHCSSPSQRRLNINTYMNIWIADQVVIVIHLHTFSPSLQSLLSEACSCAEHGLSDCLKWGRGAREHRCYWVALFTQKEWPVSASAPSVCLLSFLLCPYALFLQPIPCWHKELPFAQMVDSRGPPTLPMSVKCCPPECVWDVALAHMPSERRTRADKQTSTITKLTNRLSYSNQCLSTQPKNYKMNLLNCMF